MPKGVYPRSAAARANIAAARRARPTGPNVAKFWSKVLKGSADECWPWIGCKNGLGYGSTSGGAGRSMLAHRKAWVLTHGPIVGDILVCHRCDNPPCCNPGHLFLGSNAENMADMASKGRAHNKKIGRERALAALAEIRAGRMQKDVARALGVSSSSLSYWRKVISRRAA